MAVSPSVHKQHLLAMMTSPIFVKLQQLLSDITGNEPSEIFPDSLIHEDLNMTPMELAQFVASIEVEFGGVRIRRDQLGDFETVSDLVEYIEETVS